MLSSLLFSVLFTLGGVVSVASKTSSQNGVSVAQTKEFDPLQEKIKTDKNEKTINKEIKNNETNEMKPASTAAAAAPVVNSANVVSQENYYPNNTPTNYPPQVIQQYPTQQQPYPVQQQYPMQYPPNS